MKLKIVGSDSSGNAYILESKSEMLLIECGVHISKIKEAANWNIKKIAGCIITHSHGDHAKSIKQVLDAGINVYANDDVLVKNNRVTHHRARLMYAGKSYVINGFRVKPFEVNHDVPCFGFLIQHEEMGLCVFLTDTFYCDYTFPGANQFILECNHDQDIMFERGTPNFLRERVVQSHMNIDTCKGLLKANDLSAVNNIVLIHLSNTHSNAALFKKEIEQITGTNVFIADAGMIIENFNKSAI